MRLSLRPCFGDTMGANIITLPNLIVSNYFPDYVISLDITELVLNYFLGYVISCVVAKQHTTWISDYITSLFSN